MFKDEQRQWWAQFGIVMLLWVVFCFEGWYTAAQVWWGNEIFNHGFFIIPGSLYFVYLQRNKLATLSIKPSFIPLIFILPCVVLYVAGAIGDVRLFMHLATFGLLPLLVWMMVGHAVAWALLFPLCFVLFSVPVGEQMVPWLQEITADGSVALLRATGIPLYRTGLYIEIPQGRFLVAEACSGVSFFIASLVIGSLYAYLNFRGAPKRLMFFAIAAIFPIFANILRVYGIILIAYYTDMEYAAGADHLIYGWFFFAFVLLCLLGIGEWLRDANVQWEASADSTTRGSVSASLPAFLLLTSVLVGGAWWQGWASQGVQDPTRVNYHNALTESLSDSGCAPERWQALMQSPTEEAYFVPVPSNCDIRLYRAFFTGQGNELVSAMNRLYDPEGWSAERYGSVNINGTDIPWVAITTPSEQKRVLAHWYVINGRVFTRDLFAKLYQVALAMLGQPMAGERFVLMSAEGLEPLEAAASQFFERG